MTGNPAKPRICLLTNSFHPRIGGGETHALLLCRAWLRQDVSVTVLTRRIDPSWKTDDIVDGIPVKRLPPSGVPRLGKYLVTAPAYFELLRRKNDYDVIYVCGLRVAGVPAVFAAKRAGKVCVLRAESRGELSGGFVWDSPNEAIRKTRLKPLIKIYLRWRNRRLLKADAFVSISRDIRGEFAAEGVSGENNHLIHNGIDTNRLQPVTLEARSKLRDQLGLPDAPLFIYTGKFNKGKGLERLVRIWQQVAQSHPAARLILVGGGGGQFLSCEDDLRSFVEKNRLGNRVTFTGYQPDVRQFLQCADFFIFPSENEALSISLLEATACGLPCIASDISGNRDIIENGKNGLLVPVSDDSAWLDSISALLNDPDKASRLGQAARQVAVERFSIERVAEKHVELFQTLLAEKRGRPA